MPVSPDQVDGELLRELKRAEGHFTTGGGFVGAHYFIHRWKGHAIPDAPEERRQGLQRLIGASLVETYQVDGKTALRAVDDAQVEADEQTVFMDEEETMEIGKVEVVRRKLEKTKS